LERIELHDLLQVGIGNGTAGRFSVQANAIEVVVPQHVADTRGERQQRQNIRVDS